MKKIFKLTVFALGAILSLIGSAYYFLFRRPLPQKSGTMHLSGVHGPVEILRDKWGVPHIYAPDEHDLYYAQGYVHAEERLWQMEFNRRLVGGRLSEILGKVSIDLDRWMRILGMRQVSEIEAGNLDTTSRLMLQAYAEGVNARISQGRLPVEFNLLRFRPEPWSIVDSIAWAKMMAWNLSVNWEAEILRSLLVQKIGPKKAAELEPQPSEKWPLVFPKGLDFQFSGAAALDKAAKSRKFTGPAASSGLGSNNWVISGKRTKSGKPLLANDMHLGLSIPAIWFENHLSSGTLEITGVSFPGIPGVISGHNSSVAWGFTNGFPDVQDLYIEHIRSRPDGTVEYEFEGQWQPAVVRSETIQVKGSQPVVEKVIHTRHGPIINQLLQGVQNEAPLALKWTAYDPGNMMKALHDMNHAQSCLEFREALRNWTVPVQNMVYADVQGNIAYSYPGHIPMRKNGDGRLPVPGWVSDYEWTGYIPFDELPHQYNPPNGYIASANNRVVGDDYPYWISADFATSDRAQRIVELIEANPKIDIQAIKRMHIDWVSPSARLVNDAIQSLTSNDPELVNVIKRMSGWDGELGSGSSAASIYQVFCLKLLELILVPRLGEDLAARYMGKGPTPVLSPGSIMGERAREFLQSQLEKPDSPWFDLGNGEKRDDLMRVALRQAIDYLKDTLGPSFEDWEWGKLHKLTFSHVLGINPALKALFNRGPFAIGGDEDTIWATSATRFDLSHDLLVGPPYRMIVDLGNFSQSVSQLIPGQSGHPASAHYADNIEDWFNGNYHPVLFRFAETKENAEARLTLLPR